MKKLLLFIGAVAISLGSIAQSKSQTDLSSRKINGSVSVLEENQSSNAANSNGASRSVPLPMWIDYSAAAFDDLFYLWQFNSYYTAADTNLNYIAVSIFDTIAGFDNYSYNPSGLVEELYPSGFTYKIDSLFAYITHENNSGENDTIQLRIIELNSTGNPTSTVLWSKNIITNQSLSPSGNWLGSGAAYIIEEKCGYNVPNNKKVGIEFRYLANKADTLGLLAGAIDDGSGGTIDNSKYKNSWLRYPPFINNITKTANVGYGNPAGSQGWIECQHWGIWAYVDIPTSINEYSKNVSVSLAQNFPNPAGSFTEVSYIIDENTDVMFKIHDITGKEVMSINEGVRSAGQYKVRINTNELQSGVYFYTIIAGNETATRKMNVIR